MYSGYRSEVVDKQIGLLTEVLGKKWVKTLGEKKLENILIKGFDLESSEELLKMGIDANFFKNQDKPPAISSKAKGYSNCRGYFVRITGILNRTYGKGNLGSFSNSQLMQIYLLGTSGRSLRGFGVGCKEVIREYFLEKGLESYLSDKQTK